MSFDDAIEAGDEVVQNDLEYQDSVSEFQEADANAKELIKEFNDAVMDAQQDGVCQPQPPPPLPIPPLPPTPPFVRWLTGLFHDPNSIQGPVGFGDAQYVTASQQLSYTINFENEPTATLPTPEVTITQQLDPGLDWRTFRLGSFGWDGMIFQVPANSAYYQTRIDLSQTKGYDVDVTATIDELTGIATWTFTTIDPATGEIPLDPSIGFLVPDDANGSGEGFVSYTIMAKAADPTGTVINAQATVTFDTQPPIDTNQIFNTIDAGTGLTSAVTTLPAYENSSQFDVSWSGTDAGNGSAINSYTIFVSDDGGPFTAWLTNTTLTEAPFVGQDGHTYSFYSVATDNAGNQQPFPTSAQATTTVDVANPISSVTALPAFSPGSFTLSWAGSNPNGLGIASYDIYVSDNGGTFTPLLADTTLTSTTFKGVDGHTYAFYSVATDIVGKKQPTPTSAQATTTVDASPPTSTILALPTFSPGRFAVDWSGNDGNGSGIATYDVFVTDDGGSFAPWLVGTTLTSAVYAGLNNHIYAFYSVATDVVGNRQPTPTSAQGTTKVDATAPTSSVAALPSISLGTFTVNWSGSDAPGGSGLAYYDIYVSDNGGPFTRWLAATKATSASYTGLNGHTYGFFSVATDNVGNVEAMPTSAQATTRVSTDLDFQVTGSIANPIYGQFQYFEADLAPAGSGLPTPTGTVQFLIDGATFGSPVTLVNGVADSPSFSTLGAGSHLITADYSGDGYYTTRDGFLSETVAKANLIATADDEAKLYGSSVPALTYTFSGFVNGEDATTAGVTGSPNLTTPATAASPVGQYAIQIDVTALAAANYAIVGQNGKLTINPAVLTVTANSFDIDHYDTVPTLTYAITGYVNGDSSSVVSGSPTLGTSATSTSSAGFYPVTIAPGSLGAQNYTFAVVPGTITVHPKVMDIRVDYGSKSMSLVGLNRDLPFTDITAIDIIFSDDVAVTSGDLALTGVNLASYGYSGFSYNPATHDATWTLPTAIGIDRLMSALDGTSPAGVHTPGTLIGLQNNFNLGFAVLPGDVNGDGVVNSQDQVLVRNQIAGSGDSTLIPWEDVDGNGIVDINDFNLVKKKAGTHLP